MLRIAYMRTFGALVYRDIRFIVSHLPGRLIDGTIVVCMQTLAIGQFLPLLGMPPVLIGPLFIGIFSQIIFTAAYAITFRYINDLHRNRFINYQLTLPLPKTWLFLQIIISFMIEFLFVSMPLLFLGTVFLGPLFSLAHAHWPIAFCMYLISLSFYALLFVYLAFDSPYIWFLDNVWARRLTPLFLLGCAFFTWKKLYAFNTFLAILMLANPLTYIHEGLRAALLGQENFLSVWLCMGMVIISCIVLVWLLSRAIQKRLDPV